MQTAASPRSVVVVVLLAVLAVIVAGHGSWTK